MRVRREQTGHVVDYDRDSRAILFFDRISLRNLIKCVKSKVTSCLIFVDETNPRQILRETKVSRYLDRYGKHLRIQQYNMFHQQRYHCYHPVNRLTVCHRSFSSAEYCVIIIAVKFNLNIILLYRPCRKSRDLFTAINFPNLKFYKII